MTSRADRNSLGLSQLLFPDEPEDSAQTLVAHPFGLRHGDRPAGTTGSADGTGAAARFDTPHGLAVDGSGNIHVLDHNNSTLRKITPAGVVTTVVGAAGKKGFVPGALPGVLARPRFLAIHGNTLYLTMRWGVAVVTPLP